MSTVRIKLVEAGEVLPVRREVLRPGLPLESAVFAGDAAATHLAALTDGRIVGVASVYNEPQRPELAGSSWRLRGMAVLPETQGQGVGRRLVAACCDHVTSHGATQLWCNARVTAQRFYAGLGFDVVSEPFDIPDIGPHVVMRLRMIP